MRWRVVLLAACLAVGADWLCCRLLSRRAQAAFDSWTQAMREQGWSVRVARVQQDGFPFGARLTVRDLTLVGGMAMVPGGLDLHSERVLLSLKLIDPFRLTVEPQGEQQFRLASLPPMLVNADRLSATVKLWRHPMDSIDIVAGALAGGLQNSPHRQEVRVDGLHLHLVASRGASGRTTARVAVQARGLQLPDYGRWPLGATIHRLEFDMSLASPALSGQGAADQARAWRDWGGTLALQNLSVQWGPLHLATTARLGLDERLQPAGAGSAQVAGWADSLDALARAGTISAGVAQTAKAVLGLMAAPGAGADAALTLPFTLRDSTLSVGKVPLMRFNPVAWGGA